MSKYLIIIVEEKYVGNKNKIKINAVKLKRSPRKLLEYFNNKIIIIGTGKKYKF